MKNYFKTNKKSLNNTFFTCLTGLSGGLLFKFMGFPMPWLIGAMLAVAMVAVSSSAPFQVHMPKRLRQVMLASLGVMISATIDTSIFKGISQWWVTLLAIPFVLITQFAATQVLLKYLLPHESFATRFFGAAPGGLFEMVTLAKDNGGDERSALIMHMLRLSLLVLFAPFLFHITLGPHQKAQHMLTAEVLSYDLYSFLVTTACLVGGWVVGKTLRLPAAVILGPFLAGITCYSLGYLDTAPPFIFMIIAQVIVGADLGSKFAGYSIKRVTKLLFATTVLTGLLTSISAVAAYGMHLLVDIPFETIFLAFMPGGMTQMGLIAIFLNFNISFVLLHLLARVLCVVFLAPLCYKTVLKFSKKTPLENKEPTSAAS